MSALPICERLRAFTRASPNFIGGPSECHTVYPRNPDGPKAANTIEALVAHIAEQSVHVSNRILDGTEMGATVWRITLEDVVRENNALLAKLKGEE